MHDTHPLHQLLDQAESLLNRLDTLLPGTAPAPDWKAPAFRWRDHHLQSIPSVPPLDLDDLLHIDRPKSLLDRNTRQFVQGVPANNALLWGARGTGKSSLMRALLTRYGDQGLRMVQVDAQSLVNLPEIVAPLRDRPERFILFADDLSFEADEPAYKALKAALDGALEGTPDNVLIYATSNRRHLMPERLTDNLEVRREGDEIHPGEAVEEKVSLSERFGMWVSFHPFNQGQYLAVVEHWLTRLGGVTMDDNCRTQALRFALLRGSRSGRVAWQFARDWVGGLQVK
ncbi:ATP-binding protein [Ectothiorhodospira lacustris]|uniref:ATP-binding protein n=1 Tax=Ectothiorhodospira lacustris TaxID=2899127 RepID=UPI001EE8DFE1|nr:ATP-binding protein [Ectothiorhodospira lacustris]MCG5500329.1 ATP-binding protein [Ectothiorhodospira lacustris]MCG5510125.1 ATP-binding protein [Ectothiorhodospira lacustris]MCG5521968.1 ATP-binding protein [Ectothiorhodospira lacustris]